MHFCCRWNQQTGRPGGPVGNIFCSSRLWVRFSLWSETTFWQVVSSILSLEWNHTIAGCEFDSLSGVHKKGHGGVRNDSLESTPTFCGR